MSLLLILVCALFSCKGQTTSNYATIPALAFAEKIKNTSNPQILDVRTSEEFASQHLEHAENCNWNGEGFTTAVAHLNKNKPVFVYCTVGGRSKKAAGGNVLYRRYPL